MICSGLASAVMAEIFRNEKAEALKSSSESTAYKSLLSHISEHYADMTFNEAADFMCFSKPYFSKYFRRMSGMTFSEYLNIVRVSAAAKCCPKVCLREKPHLPQASELYAASTVFSSSSQALPHGSCPITMFHRRSDCG